MAVKVDIENRWHLVGFICNWIINNNVKFSNNITYINKMIHLCCYQYRVATGNALISSKFEKRDSGYIAFDIHEMLLVIKQLDENICGFFASNCYKQNQLDSRIEKFLIEVLDYYKQFSLKQLIEISNSLK